MVSGVALRDTSTNDQPAAVLYTRVSSRAQAEEGYSLREQAERLRRYAAEHGLEVLEVCEDAGVSGAALDRPGLNRARELVAAGGVSVVLATERDRFAREPAYLYLLRKEFEENGTKLRALNDQGDDSPVGELTAGMLDQIAKFYRATFAAKSMDNKRKKAREGKASGSGVPPFGYAYTEDRRALVVDEPRMAVVRRLFSMVADGATLHTVKKTFEGEGVPPPGGGRWWYTMSMSRMVRQDAYLPRTVEELRGLGVGEDVISGLDPEGVYGAWWSGRERVKLTPDARNKRRFERNPEGEWVAVPVPASGVTRETAEAARAALSGKGRPRRGSPTARFFELRGLVRCESCGVLLTTYTTGADRTTGKKYAYYACQRRRKHGRDACDGPTLPAGDTELEVLQWAEGLIQDPDALVRRMDGAIERERRSARDPGAAQRALAGRAAELEGKRERLVDLAADGLLGKDDLARRLAGVDAERRTVEAELSRAREAAGRVEELERTKAALADAFGTGLRLGLTWMPPALRAEVYGALGLRLTARPDGGLHAEARVDPGVIRFSREVERYARALVEAERRVGEAPPEPAAERLERVERELARVRRELSSPPATETVMAEVAG